MIPSGLISHSRKVKRPLHDTFVSRDRKKCCWSKIYGLKRYQIENCTEIFCCMHWIFTTFFYFKMIQIYVCVLLGRTFKKIHFSLKRFSSPYPWRWRWKRREQVPISIQNKRAAASMSLKVPLQKCKFSSPSLMTPHSQLNRNPPPHFLKGQWQNCSTTFSSCKTFNQGEKRPKKGLAWNEEIWRAQKRSSLLLCSFSVLL